MSTNEFFGFKFCLTNQDGEANSVAIVRGQTIGQRQSPAWIQEKISLALVAWQLTPFDQEAVADEDFCDIFFVGDNYQSGLRDVLAELGIFNLSVEMVEIHPGWHWEDALVVE
jgi:hypothetical protein